MDVLKKFDCALGKLYDVLFYVCAFLLAVLLTLSFANVATRLLNVPLAWADEAMRFVMIWMAFLACPVLIDRKAHLVVDLVASLFHKKAHGVMYTIGEIMAFVFLVYLLFPCITLVGKSFVAMSSAMRIPMGLVYLCIPIGVGLSALAQLRRIGKRFLFKEGADSAGTGGVA